MLCFIEFMEQLHFGEITGITQIGEPWVALDGRDGLRPKIIKKLGKKIIKNLFRIYIWSNKYNRVLYIEV
jgi:hypothetical protein